jgi:hypothetical protein
MAYSSTCDTCKRDYALQEKVWVPELLDLIEKAENNPENHTKYMDGSTIKTLNWNAALTVVKSVKSYLSGDPSALKKLAGVA